MSTLSDYLLKRATDGDMPATPEGPGVQAQKIQEQQAANDESFTDKLYNGISNVANTIKGAFNFSHPSFYVPDEYADTTPQEWTQIAAQNDPHYTGFAMGFSSGVKNTLGAPLALVGYNGLIDSADEDEKQWAPIRQKWDEEYGDNILTNPNKIANWTGNAFGSMVGMYPAGLATPTGLVTRGTGLLTRGAEALGGAAARRGATGLGTKLASMANSKLGQEYLNDVVRGAVGQNLFEAAGEYGNVVHDLKEGGMGHAQALLYGLPDFVGNVGLGVLSNGLEFPIMRGATGRIFHSKAGEGMARRIAGAPFRAAPAMLASMGIEGAEELAQQTMSNANTGQPWGNPLNPNAWTDDQKESFLGGAFGGLALGGAGHLMGAYGYGTSDPVELLANSNDPSARKIAQLLTDDANNTAETNAADDAAIQQAAASGDPSAQEIAQLAAEDAQPKQQANTTIADPAAMAEKALQETNTDVQRQHIGDFLNNNTIDQIGSDNYDYLVNVFRNGNAETVAKAYKTVVEAERNTAIYEAKQRAAAAPRAIGMNANTGNPNIDAVINAANTYGIDPKILLAMAARESGGDDVNAITMNPVGDGPGGMMQITDETAENYGINEKYPNWKTDPQQNALAGADVLSHKIEEAGGDVWDGVRRYNGGGSAAEAYREQIRANYDNMGDVGGSAGGGAPTQQQYYTVETSMNPQFDGMDSNTLTKMNLLARDFYQKYGHKLNVTSLKRDGDGSSYHDDGHAFDFSDDFLEQNPDAREWLVNQGERYGLKGLDEFSHPVDTTDGGNVHFSDHGGPIPAGALEGMENSGNGDGYTKFDAAMDRENSEADAEEREAARAFDADTDKDIDNVMNDDSEQNLFKNDDANTNTGSDLFPEKAITADDVVPQVAEDIARNYDDPNEVENIERMFDVDSNGNLSFIDSPANSEYIKSQYGDLIKKAVQKAMKDQQNDYSVKTPDLLGRFKKQHAESGQSGVSIKGNKVPQVQAPQVSRPRTPMQQVAPVNDNLQQTQLQARQEAMRNGQYPTPQQLTQLGQLQTLPNQQAAQEIATRTAQNPQEGTQQVQQVQPNQQTVETPVRANTATETAVPALSEADQKARKRISGYRANDGIYQGGLNRGKITVFENKGKARGKWNFTTSLDELENRVRNSNDDAQTTLNQLIDEKIADKKVGRANTKKGVASMADVINHLYQNATGHTLDSLKQNEQTEQTEAKVKQAKEKGGEVNGKNLKNQRENAEPQQAESQNAESTDAEKGKKSHVQEKEVDSYSSIGKARKEFKAALDKYDHGEYDNKQLYDATDAIRKKLDNSKYISDKDHRGFLGYLTRTENLYMQLADIHTEPYKKVINATVNAYERGKISEQKAISKLNHVAMDANRASHGQLAMMDTVQESEKLTGGEALKVRNAVNDALARVGQIKDEKTQKKVTPVNEWKDQKKNPYEDFLKSNPEIAQKIDYLVQNLGINKGELISLVLHPQGRMYHEYLTHLRGSVDARKARAFYKDVTGKKAPKVHSYEFQKWLEEYLDDFIQSQSTELNRRKEIHERNEADIASSKKRKEYNAAIDQAEDDYNHGKLNINGLNDKLDEIAKSIKEDKDLNEHSSKHLLEAIQNEKSDFASVDATRRKRVSAGKALPRDYKLKTESTKSATHTTIEDNVDYLAQKLGLDKSLLEKELKRANEYKESPSLFAKFSGLGRVDESPTAFGRLWKTVDRQKLHEFYQSINGDKPVPKFRENNWCDKVLRDFILSDGEKLPEGVELEEKETPKGESKHGTTVSRKGESLDAGHPNEQSDVLSKTDEKGTTGRAAGSGKTDSESNGTESRRPAGRTTGTKANGQLLDKSATDKSDETAVQGNATGRTEQPAAEVEKITNPAQKPNAKATEIPGGDYHMARVTSYEGIGKKTLFKRNMAAIKLLKQLEMDNRLATPEEQKILAQYSGWGSLADAFSNKSEWAKENAELRDTLTKEEYDNIESSITTAYYTPPKLVQTIWKAVQQLGFKRGKVLDPSMGTGIFFATMPKDMYAKSNLYGVEMEGLVGGISKQLYQSADVSISPYEKARFAPGFFDLAITNVPFATGVHPYDPKYNKKGDYNLHGFYFAKSIDVVRPGGFVVFITSHNTMDDDREGKILRAELNKTADLVAAYRLPNTTFQQNAKTNPTTDIIILQRRMDNSKPAPYAQEWLDTRRIPEIRYGSLNEYYANHPDHILGTLKEDYRGELTVDGYSQENGAEIDVAKALNNAIKDIPKDIYKPTTTTHRKAEPLASFKAGDERDGAIVEKDGKLFQNNNGTFVEMKVAQTMQKKMEKVVRGYLGLRGVAKGILRAQLDENVTDKALDAFRRKLNKVYDEFVKANGYVNSKKNARFYASDPDYGLVGAFENYAYNKKTKTETATKAAIFSKRTTLPQNEITKADTPQDALAVSIAQHGYVDMPYIANLLGRDDVNKIADELKGEIYKDPATDSYVLAEEYLSGNVRKKLEEAKEMAKTNKAYDANVKALEKVQPPLLNESQITVKLGQNWISTEDYNDFLRSLLGNRKVTIAYEKQTGKWIVDKNSRYSNTENYKQWSVDGAEFPKLLEWALGMKPAEITYKDANGNRMVDGEATEAANAKIEELQNAFTDWLWSDNDRKTRLLNTYNNLYNNWVLRKYDGSHLAFHAHGMSADIELRPHQKDAVWRIMQRKNTLLAHCVGSGKTFTMQAAGMEMKRLGIINKPLYAVPNNVVKQFENDFRQLYPDAKILTLTSSDLPAAKLDRDSKFFDEKLDTSERTEKDAERKKESKEDAKTRDNRLAKRQRTLNRIATEDWDAIIISHEMFEKMPMSGETYNKFYKEQLANLEQTIRAAEAQKEGRSSWSNSDKLDTRTLKRLKKAKANLEAKLKRDVSEESKEIVTPFEELGIDQIFVDEADMFKNLYFPTTHSTVKGISTTGAMRSTDMYVKTRWMSEKYNGGGVCFATGTPISNSMNEIYTMQRYLDYQGLKDLGIDSFDSWLTQFGDIKASYELDNSGDKLKKVERASFDNIPQLITQFRKFADIKMPEDLPYIKRPTLKNGKPTIVEVQPSDYYVNVLKPAMIKRLNELPSGYKHKPGEDNVLAWYNDYNNMAIDLRLYDMNIPEADAANKLNALADTVADKYKATTKATDKTAENGAQLIFCDLGVDKKSKKSKKAEAETNDNSEFAAESQESISLYQHIKDALIKRGIPEKEIAFVHEAKDKDEKQELFNRVNAGEIRVLIGTTAKMGAGTNCQKHLVGLHHFTLPARPRDMEQREGRILRQGNLNKEVETFYYVMKETNDAKNFSRLEQKAKMIHAIMRGDDSIQNMDDIGEDVSNYSTARAEATNDPRLFEQAKLSNTVNRLSYRKNAFEKKKRENQYRLAKIPEQLEGAKNGLDAVVKDINQRTDTTKGGKMQITIGKKTYSKTKDAEKALAKALENFKNQSSTKIGNIGGFDIKALIRPNSSSRNEGGIETKHGILVMSLVKNRSYHVNVPDSLNSIIYTVNNAPERAQEQLQAKINKLTQSREVLTQEVKKTFAQEDELQDAVKRLDEINEELTSEDKGSATNNKKMSADAQKEPTNRTVKEIANEVKSLLPNAEKVDWVGTRLTFTMKNGNTLQFDIKDSIELTGDELERARRENNIPAEMKVNVNGTEYTVNGNAFIELARNGKIGSAAHELVHVAMELFLNDKEKAVLRKHYGKQAAKENRDVDEVVADAGRDLYINNEKQHSKVPVLLRKIWDGIKKLRDILNGSYQANKILNSIVSGEVFERTPNTGNAGRRFSAEEQQEETITPQDVIDAINDVVPIYESSKLNKKERQSIIDNKTFDWTTEPGATGFRSKSLYNKKAQAGFNTQGWFNLSNYGRIIALHLDHVLKIKGNLELTNDVLDTQDRNRGMNKIVRDANVELTPTQAHDRALMDFGAMLLQNPELAQERFPRYSALFEEALEKHPEIKAKLDRVIELNEQYQGQTAAERANASIAKRGKTELKFRKTPIKWLRQNWRDLYTRWMDDKDPLNKMQKMAEAEIGQRLGWEYDVHAKAQMALSNAGARSWLLLTGGKSKEEVLGVLNKIYNHAITKKVVLKDVMDALNNVSDADIKQSGAKTAYDALGNYLIAMRTEELAKKYKNDYVRSAGYDAKTTAEIIKNTPDSIKKAAQMYWGCNINLVNILQQQGLISRDLAAKLRKYKYYCPMYRDMGDSATTMDDMINNIGVFSTGSGYIDISNGIKTIEGGGKRPVVDPIIALSQMTASVISKCERNAVGKAFVKLGQDFAGLGNIVVRDPTLTHANPSLYAFTVWENGKQVVYRTDPELYDALAHIDQNTATWGFKVAQKLANALRVGATISPSFIIRNFIRDTISASINSKFNFIPIVDSVRGAWKLKTDKKFAAEYYASGASMSTYINGNVKAHKSLVKEFMGHQYDSWPIVLKQIRQVIAGTWNIYSDFGDLVENSPRAAEFMKARKRGLTVGQAGYLARDITVDFSRHGSKGRDVNKYVSFFNATIQGTDKFVRSFKDHPGKAILATAFYIILPTLGLWWANHDQDWYKELDENTKNQNWCIGLLGGTHLLIPKPQEAGVLIGSGLEAVLNQLTGSDPHAIKEWAKQARDTLMPSMFPIIAIPIIEWIANYSFWRGLDIVPQSLKNQPSELQYNSYTSEIAKILGDTPVTRAMKLSPMAIDNFITSWFGSAGRLVANTLNDPLSAIRGNSRPPEPAKMWNEMPIIGSFVRQNGQTSRYIERMYDLQKEMSDDHERDATYRAWKGKAKKGQKDPTKPTDLKKVDKAVSSVSKLYGEIRDVRNDPKMSPEAKRAKIDKNTDKIREIAKKVVVEFDDQK